MNGTVNNRMRADGGKKGTENVTRGLEKKKFIELQVIPYVKSNWFSFDRLQADCGFM